jgi:hypothetical protein
MLLDRDLLDRDHYCVKENAMLVALKFRVLPNDPRR